MSFLSDKPVIDEKKPDNFVLVKSSLLIHVNFSTVINVDNFVTFNLPFSYSWIQTSLRFLVSFILPYKIIKMFPLIFQNAF